MNAKATAAVTALMATKEIRKMAREILLSGHPIQEFAAENGEPTYDFLSSADDWYERLGGETVPGQRIADVARAVLAIAFPEPNPKFDRMLELEEEAREAHLRLDGGFESLEERRQRIIDCRNADDALAAALSEFTPEEVRAYATYRLPHDWLRDA